MIHGNQKAAFLVLAASIISMAWAGAAQRPYWFLLSMFSFIWAAAALWKRKSSNTAAVQVCGASLVLVPILGFGAGPSSAEPLEVFISPVVLFSLSLAVISSTLQPSADCNAGTLAFFTFLLAVSMGTLALLSLYYLDSMLFTALMPTNSALMWPLTSLLVGSVAISLTLRVTGLERMIWRSKEARG